MILIGLLLVVIQSCISKRYTKNIYNIDKGFAYEIIYNKKVIIKQEHIPSIDCYQLFLNKKEAIKVADLVIEKLENKKIPSIGLDDLKRLKVNFNCLVLQ